MDDLGEKKHFRVLALSYLFPNPAWPNYGIFVLNRLKALQRFCEIRVVTPIPWFPGFERLKRYNGLGKVPRKTKMFGLNVVYPRFFVIPRFLKFLDSITYFLSTCITLILLKKKSNIKFDIIDVHWVYPDILSGFLLSKMFGKPFIVTVRGKEALHLNERSLRKVILCLFLRKAHHVVCLSTELKNIVINLGVQEKNVSVILNGIDTNKFYPISKVKCRDDLSLGRSQKIIISVGSLILRKGYLELFQAIDHGGMREGIQVYIVGDANPEGNDIGILKKEIQRLKLQNVHFVGELQQHELVHWLNASDLFCLLSHGEGCPNVLMEALACGVPVLATSVGAVPDIVQEGRDGCIVRGHEIKEISDKISFCLSQQWNRKLIAGEHQKRTWAHCAEEVMNVYKHVLSEF